MNVQESILKEFDDLLAETKSIMVSCGYDDNGDFERLPKPHDYLRIRTRASNLISRVCGSDSDHAQALNRVANAKDADIRPERLSVCFGIVEAARTDFDHGLLLRLKSLIEAEVIGDFLEQAERLLGAGFFVPAASLIGAVLEDGLRKLSDARGIGYSPKTTIDSLNVELAKAEVYNKLVQKQITALADIRNSADHGNFGNFKQADVQEMLKWVTRFLADYLK